MSMNQKKADPIKKSNLVAFTMTTEGDPCSPLATNKSNSCQRIRSQICCVPSSCLFSLLDNENMTGWRQTERINGSRSTSKDQLLMLFESKWIELPKGAPHSFI